MLRESPLIFGGSIFLENAQRSFASNEEGTSLCEILPNVWNNFEGLTMESFYLYFFGTSQAMAIFNAYFSVPSSSLF